MSMFGFGDGFDYYIMDSSEKADRVIEFYKRAIDSYSNPDMVSAAQVFADAGVNPNDLDSTDMNRIEFEVNEYLKDLYG